MLMSERIIPNYFWECAGVSRSVVSESLGFHGLFGSLPGSSVHGIFQARIAECIAISFSRRSPDPGIKRGSPALQADALLSERRGGDFQELGCHPLLGLLTVPGNYRDVSASTATLSHVQLCVTLWKVTHQAPLSKRFSRHEYWSGLACPLPRDLMMPLSVSFSLLIEDQFSSVQSLSRVPLFATP